MARSAAPLFVSMATGVSAREFLAEMAGTALLIGIGLMGEARVATAASGSTAGTTATLAAVWTVAVMVACYTVAPVSGAHLNPAVSVALAAAGRFAWVKVPGYVLGQLVGGFSAAWVVRILTVPLIERYDPALTERSQDVFATSPGYGVGQGWALANEVLATFVLVVALLVLLEQAERHTTIAALEPLLIAVVVGGIGLSMSSLSGWAINPARDLPPRLVEWLTGYAHAWLDRDGVPYWWVPVLGPILGGLLAAMTWRASRNLDAADPCTDELPVCRARGERQ